MYDLVEVVARFVILAGKLIILVIMSTFHLNREHATPTCQYHGF